MVPIRECIGCGGRFEKKRLFRIVKQNGVVSLDPEGKAPGRGAYLCRDAACLERCVKRKRLNHAFHQNVPEEVYEALAREMRRYLE